MNGYHDNYTPTVAQIEGKSAMLVTPELPGTPGHWVEVKRLEPVL